jgi:hypothetical protein
LTKSALEKQFKTNERPVEAQVQGGRPGSESIISTRKNEHKRVPTSPKRGEKAVPGYGVGKVLNIRTSVLIIAQVFSKKAKNENSNLRRGGLLGADYGGRGLGGRGMGDRLTSPKYGDQGNGWQM